MNSTKCILMNNNLKISQLALGTFQTRNEEMEEVIENAIEIDYRHIDCAWIYGNGKEIVKKKDQNKREEEEDKLITDFIETWKGMELLIDENLIKSIVINQIELHPYCPLLQLTGFCQKHQILIEVYSPLDAKNREWKNANDPEVLEDKNSK